MHDFCERRPASLCAGLDVLSSTMVTRNVQITTKSLERAADCSERGMRPRCILKAKMTAQSGCCEWAGVEKDSWHIASAMIAVAMGTTPGRICTHLIPRRAMRAHHSERAGQGTPLPGLNPDDPAGNGREHPGVWPCGTPSSDSKCWPDRHLLFWPWASSARRILQVGVIYSVITQ